MAKRSGTGPPPAGCTCYLNHWESMPGIREWSIHVADPVCPHHRSPDDALDSPESRYIAKNRRILYAAALARGTCRVDSSIIDLSDIPDDPADVKESLPPDTCEHEWRKVVLYIDITTSRITYAYACTQCGVTRTAEEMQRAGGRESFDGNWAEGDAP